jgi:hypothetical protein
MIQKYRAALVSIGLVALVFKSFRKVVVAALVALAGVLLVSAPAYAASTVFVVASDGVVSEWVIPSIPPVLLIVLNFVSPYIVSVFSAFTWSPNAKKVTAVIVSFVISGGVIAIALWAGWVPLDNSPVGIITLVGLGLVLQQTAYDKFFKDSATEVMKTVGVGKHSA